MSIVATTRFIFSGSAAVNQVNDVAIRIGKENQPVALASNGSPRQWMTPCFRKFRA